MGSTDGQEFAILRRQGLRPQCADERRPRAAGGQVDGSRHQAGEAEAGQEWRRLQTPPYPGKPMIELMPDGWERDPPVPATRRVRRIIFVGVSLGVLLWIGVVLWLLS